MCLNFRQIATFRVPYYHRFSSLRIAHISLSSPARFSFSVRRCMNSRTCLSIRQFIVTVIVQFHKSSYLILNFQKYKLHVKWPTQTLRYAVFPPLQITLPYREYFNDMVSVRGRPMKDAPLGVELHILCC